jgi:hypothetical protein
VPSVPSTEVGGVVWPPPASPHDDTGGVRRGVAIKTLELLRDDEKTIDDRIVLALDLETRFIGDRLRQRHRVRRILRHEFAKPINLPIGQLQDAADIAEHRPRLQGAEGNDLGNLIGAVFRLNVLDDFVAPILTEINVKIRHRNAIRIEKAFKDQ